jgi:hypothetical protein
MKVCAECAALLAATCSPCGAANPPEHRVSRVKDRNLRERADVAILCVNPTNPYHWMAINGKVVEMIEETDPAKGREAADNVNELARRYINTTPYPLRDPRGEVRVLFKVRPTYVMTCGPPPTS